jgi:hypothetical protein
MKTIYIVMNDRTEKVLTQFHVSGVRLNGTVQELNSGFAANGANMFATANAQVNSTPEKLRHPKTLSDVL